MAARRGKSQARRSGGGNNGLPGWAWLVIGVLLALVVVLMAPKFIGGKDGEGGFFRIGAPHANPDAQPQGSSETDGAFEPVGAEPAAKPGATGNAETGRVLAYTCQGCHGITGYKNAYPNYRVPKIGGQSAQYLSQALAEYREGKRKHPTMQAQSMSFSTQDIADLSAYLSTLK